MADYIMMTDSSCDLPYEYYKEHDLEWESLTFTINGAEYRDDAGQSYPYKKFYDDLRTGAVSKTSMISVEVFLAAFEKFASAGKNILYLAFTSGLSGTYGSAAAAADELKGKYPNVRIVVVDTLCASMGQGLMIDYCVNMRDNGATMDEIAAWVVENRQNFHHVVTVDDLMHLFRGGRLTRSSAIVGSLLGVKPIIVVNHEGSLVSVEKQRGRKKALLRLVEILEESTESDTLDAISIAHTDCVEDALFVRDEINKRFKVGKFLFNFIGPVIGTHTGPGTVVIFFKGKLRPVVEK